MRKEPQLHHRQQCSANIYLCLHIQIWKNIVEEAENKSLVPFSKSILWTRKPTYPYTQLSSPILVLCPISSNINQEKWQALA